MEHLNSIRDLLKSCSRCGTCKLTAHIYRPSCPAGEHFSFEAYYPSGKIGLALGLLEGKLTVNENFADIIFSCTTCGNCTVECPMPHGKKLLEIYEVLRAECVSKIGFRKPHQEIKESINDYGNPYRQPRRKKGKWAKELKDLRRGNILYFAGCTSSLHAELSDIPSISIKYLMESLNGIMVLGEDEPCCGSILLRTGGIGEFSSLAEKNTELFKKLGIKKIITSCAGCYKTFKFDYPRFVKFDIEVQHITQSLSGPLKEKKLRASEKLVVTYHDPCHLGRLGKIFDEPREIINSVKNVELVEMRRTREYSFCCGSGGGVKSYKPEWAVENASRRVKEAEETGATFLITSCPFCVQNLRDGAKFSNSPLRVMDLLEFLEIVSPS